MTPGSFCWTLWVAGMFVITFFKAGIHHQKPQFNAARKLTSHFYSLSIGFGSPKRHS